MTSLNLPQKPKILTPQERRERNKEEMRKLILDTALEIMHEDGAGALNLNELARRVHLKTSSLYVYFPGKMAIYDALYRFGIRIFTEELDRITGSIVDPWQALEAVITRTIEISVDRPELFQICFERPIPGFQPSPHSMSETGELTARMSRLLARALPVATPESPQNLPVQHGLFIALWHGLTALHIANDPDLPAGKGRFGSLIPAGIRLIKSYPLQTGPQPGLTPVQKE